jgi:hypothetical protein
MRQRDCLARARARERSAGFRNAMITSVTVVTTAGTAA